MTIAQPSGSLSQLASIVVGLDQLLNTLQSRYSILLYKTWNMTCATPFNVKYGNSAFTGTFAATFWPGYTQEVSIFSLAVLKPVSHSFVRRREFIVGVNGRGIQVPDFNPGVIAQ